jgi:hypothetical protein
MEKDKIKDDLEDFALCLENEADQRKTSLEDLEFSLLSKQWNPDDVSAREAEGRPCLTINRMTAFGKQVLNDAKINKTSIDVKPVGGGADKLTADIQSDVIRNIETQSQSDQVYDTAFQFAIYGGFGYFRVNVDYVGEDAWDQDIFLERISNPFSVYGDYDGKEATSIDWNRCFVTDWYSKAVFEAKWGKDKKAGSFDVGSGDYDANWFKDKRIRVAERWIREEVPTKLLKISNGAIMFEDVWLKNQDDFLSQGLEVDGERDSKTHKVKQRLITGTDVLEESDWLGKYIPIVPMYGEEINVNGKRYFLSLIHRAKDSQRLYNYQRTLAAELGGLQPKAPWTGPVGMFATDAAKWQNANRVAYPYLEWDPVEGAPGGPQRIAFAGPPAGAMQDALMASDDMKAVIGMYDASLGARSNETSGRAIIARKHEGDTSTFDFVNNRNIAVEHGGRIILDLIPRLYTTERILRCVQEDGSTYTVPVNQPVAPEHEIQRMQVMAMGPMQPQAMQPGMSPQGATGMSPDVPQQGPEQPTGGPPKFAPVPPELQQQLPPHMLDKLNAVTRIFDLTTGKYDVMVTAGPGFNSRREEAATQMMEFIRVFPQSAPLIGDLLAKNLDWPGAEQVAERLKAMVPPQAQGQINPMVQNLQNMLKQQDAQAKQAVGQLQQQIAGLSKQVQDKNGELQIKAQEVSVKQFEAETRRAEVMRPEIVQQQQIDPIKVAELQLAQQELGLKAQEHELAEREMAVKEYSAETERLTLLAARLPPEAFQMLVMKTTGEAMSTHLESSDDDQCGAMAGQMAGAMPMPEPAMRDGTGEPGDMGGEQDDSQGMPMNGMNQQTMPPDGMGT